MDDSAPTRGSLRLWATVALAIGSCALVACGGDDGPAGDAMTADAAVAGDGGFPDCVFFDQTKCAIRLFCAPTCTSIMSAMCNCTCEGPVDGSEGCGCAECPKECFEFDVCVDVGCPASDAIGITYVSQDPADCGEPFSCLPNEIDFNDECGCGCIDPDLAQ